MNSSLNLQQIAHLIVDHAEELQRLSLQFNYLKEQVKRFDFGEETEVSWSNSQGQFTEESLLEAIAAFEEKLSEYR